MMRKIPTLALIAVLGAASSQVHPQDEARSGPSDEVWLDSLITETPQQGFELAVTLSRRGVLTTQPDVDVLRDLRTAYARNPESLIAVSRVIAIHFQTVAAANDYWRSSETSADSVRPAPSERD
jgi:hypothetical protein